MRCMQHHGMHGGRVHGPHVPCMPPVHAMVHGRLARSACHASGSKASSGTAEEKARSTGKAVWPASSEQSHPRHPHMRVHA
jgi:hypothetical protein